MPKIVDLLGKRFGKLVVLRKLSSNRGGSILWECACDCGRIYEASTRHLNRKNNTVRSCGCDQYQSGFRHRQWTGHGEISGHWWSAHVKHSANSPARKSCELSITKEYAMNLFLEQDKKCYFTGELLQINNLCAENTASIDRIDNTLGYIPGNIRWVHKTINMMKRIYSDEYFVEWCTKVAKKASVESAPFGSGSGELV
jgi:hypothetical protein